MPEFYIIIAPEKYFPEFSGEGGIQGARAPLPPPPPPHLCNAYFLGVTSEQRWIVFRSGGVKHIFFEKDEIRCLFHTDADRKIFSSAPTGYVPWNSQVSVKIPKFYKNKMKNQNIADSEQMIAVVLCHSWFGITCIVNNFLLA